MSKRPYKQIDISTIHLTDVAGFDLPVPRRHEGGQDLSDASSANTMSVRLRRGTEIASAMLGLIDDEESIDFARTYISAAGINTAWYVSARTATNVQRRSVSLPRLDEGRPDTTSILEQARDGFKRSAEAARGLVIPNDLVLDRVPADQRRFARNLATASLTLAATGIDLDRVYELDDFGVQDEVRERSLSVLEDARTLHQVVNGHPHLAAFAVPDSDLSVHWRRQAPSGAYDALEQAIDELAA